MVQLLTIPMACVSALAFLFSAVFAFISFRLSRLGEKPSRLYPLFTFLGLSNGVFLGAFCFVINLQGNDLLRNIAHRTIMVAASVTFPLSIHFYASYFGLMKRKTLRAILGFAYASAAIMAAAAIPPWKFFLAWEVYPTSAWYSGCVYGPLLYVWGAWAAAMMVANIAVLATGTVREIRARAGLDRGGRASARPDSEMRRDRLLPSILLAATNSAWFVTGILDDLTCIQFIDLPPLTWTGSFLIVTAIAFILCDEIVTYHGERQRLYREITRDPLTGAGSRAFFSSRFDKAYGEALLASEPLYLILADCDDFKAINDNQGHAMGDAVLKAVAEEIARNLRPYDTVARYGGDEFVILPRDVSSDDAARQLCTRLVEGFANLRVSAFGKTTAVTCSLGIARLDPMKSGDSPDIAKASLLHHADCALYESKRAGKNRYTLFAPAPRPEPAPEPCAPLPR